MRYFVKSLSYWDCVFFSTIFQLNGNKVLSSLFPWLSHSGSGHLYPFIAVLFFFTMPEIASNFLHAGLIAFAIELPLYKLIKNSVKRDRPCDALNGVDHIIIPSDRFSFPSGHTAAAIIMALLISHFIPALTIPIFFWAILVGFSRIYVGVHYPTDILAGAVLGLLSGLTGLSVIS